MFPHDGQCGGIGIGTRRSSETARQPVQRTFQMFPCSSTRLRLPARACKPSTFCVNKRNCACRVPRSLSILTRARWAGFGSFVAISSRRQLYHSHTSFGLRSKASGVARSSARKFFHRPASICGGLCGAVAPPMPSRPGQSLAEPDAWPGPRNVGIPLSAEMPAPLRTVTREAFARRSRTCSMDDFMPGIVTAAGT